MAKDTPDMPNDADADGPASGSVEHPIAPDDPQPGDSAELASNLGGPVDIAPGARRGPAAQQGAPGARPVPRPGGAGTSKPRD